MKPKELSAGTASVEPFVAVERLLFETSIGRQWLGRLTSGSDAGRLVMVRQLPASWLSPEHRARLGELALRYAKVRNPAFLRLLGVVEQQESWLTVSEHLIGVRLLDVMARARQGTSHLPAAVAVRIVLDTARALDKAHCLAGELAACRPARLFAAESVYVAAFGGILLTEVGVVPEMLRVCARRAQPQVISQLSPEEVQGSSAEPQGAEVFSLGVTLWECLANRRLFACDDMNGARDELLHRPIPALDRLERVGLPIPRTLVDIVRTATERDPSRRFSSHQEFADALEQLPANLIGNEYQVAQALRKLAGDALLSHRADDSSLQSSGTFSQVPPSRHSTRPPGASPSDFEPPTLAQRRLVSGFQSNLPDLGVSDAGAQQPILAPSTPDASGVVTAIQVVGAAPPKRSSRNYSPLMLGLLALGGALLAVLLSATFIGRGKTAAASRRTQTIGPTTSVLAPPAGPSRLVDDKPVPAASAPATPAMPSATTLPESVPSPATGRSDRGASRASPRASGATFRPKQITPYRPKGI